MKHILDCTGHKLRIPNIIDSDGVYLFDANGKRYMDLESGIWCTSLGHSNVRIGRTGKWFGYQHYDLKPDMIAIGKGIGNGYPVSAAVFSKNVISELDAFKYSQSHQNDPMGAAVANEVINIIKDNDLIRDAARKGQRLFSQLKRLERSNIIIRGKGLMFAIDFMNEKTTEKVYRELIENGYIVCNRGSFLRIDPPLTITEDEYGKFISTLFSILDREMVIT